MKGYEDLVNTLKSIQSTGMLDCSNEAAIEYQDMIGNSTWEQLDELSNGDYKEAFYRVYGQAYGTIQAIRFHCEHGQKIRDMIERNADLEAEIDKRDYLLTVQEEKTETAQEATRQWQKANAELTAALDAQAAEIEELKAQMQTLKAKMYDLMTA